MTVSRVLLAAVWAIGLLVVSSGCGGASDTELQQARIEGAKEARQAETLKEIRRGIATLKKKQQSGSTAPVVSPPSSAPYTGSGPSKDCGNGIGVNSNTTCPFAYNVAGAYVANPGSTSIVAYSPKPEGTGLSYTMTCSPWSGGGTVCRGGNDAAVFIR